MTDVIILTGRFNPAHFGHTNLIDAALKEAEVCVVCHVCSACQSRTLKNPFSAQERIGILRDIYALAIATNKLILVATDDQPTDNQWKKAILSNTDFMLYQKFGEHLLNYSYAVMSSNKHADHKLRREWFFPLGVIVIDTEKCISATDIRNKYFSEKELIVSKDIPWVTEEFLKEFKKTSDYTYLQHQYLEEIGENFNE